MTKKKKITAPIRTPLERVVSDLKWLTPDEKIGVIKLLTLELAGMRLYTDSEIEQILAHAVEIGVRVS